ncbi:MAG: UDP-N-acetylglucosamine 2-epimerase (non-hydrolyzing) [Bacteroidales bacterium]|nr:UDP-N-acetylglucosamine 2-epimerase (non-hydrolyzing) [Bacteroidales bacterium]
MKIVTIIGARPQIIKAAALSRAIRNHFADRIQEVIVHTGQHYDENMSQVFFDELQIPRPDYNLNVGSASHGIQTARMTEGIEALLIKEQPDFIVLYGDTNSTLAGAVAAAKIHVPIVHIEAGLRSFNKSMPEEINRIVCDHCSTLLFTPTQAGLENLKREGFSIDESGVSTSSTTPSSGTAAPTIDNPKVYHCGDIMYDNSLHFSTVAEEKTTIIRRLDLEGKPFILATIHRDNNTDHAERLNAIFNALLRLAEDNIIVLPLHPRTAKMLKTNLDTEKQTLLFSHANIRIVPPVSFLEMVALERHAQLVMTDSGGVQKEAYFFKKPCIILRQETEWVEIVATGNAILADADEGRILQAWQHFESHPATDFPPIFGDGHAAEFMLSRILECRACHSKSDLL